MFSLLRKHSDVMGPVCFLWMFDLAVTLCTVNLASLNHGILSISKAALTFE